MSYNKTLVSSKQKAVLKSITDLLEVLSEIDINDANGNDGEIVLDDGSIMTLSLSADNDRNSLHIEKVSVTNARLNLDIIVSRNKQITLRKDDNVIRLVKKKPEKIIVTLKKKDRNE